MLFDGPLLNDTPFEAESSMPVVIINVECTKIKTDCLKELIIRSRYQKSSDRTVKLQTFGLDKIDCLSEDEKRVWAQEEIRMAKKLGWGDLKIEYLAGAIVISGPGSTLKEAAASLDFLEKPLRAGYSNYTYIGSWSKTTGQTGEVQVFGDYERMLTEARIARERLEATCANTDWFELQEQVRDLRVKLSTHRLQARK